VINEVVIFATDAKDMVERPTVEPTYSTLVGQKKAYSYLPIRPGVMASRCSSHWCEACMRVRGPGAGLSAGLVIDGVAGKCTGTEKTFTEHHVERVDAVGVANERKRAQTLGHKLARKLKVGNWVAVQARERWSTKEVVHYRAGTPPLAGAACSHAAHSRAAQLMCAPVFVAGHYWIGRVVDAGAKHHLGAGVLKQVTKRREDINDTMFTEGDIAIAIEWYDRTDDEDGLSFTKEVGPEADAATPQSIINSTELRAASSTPFDNGLHFTMGAVVEQTIAPALVVTPALTRSGRSAAVVELAVPLAPDNTVYRVPETVDQEIRRGCWLGGRYM
jgi:hypothetical protein